MSIQLKLVRMGLSPELVHARKQHGLGLWLTQSDARYLCGQRRRAFFCAAAFLMPVLPSEKKTLCPCTSVLDLIFLDFWINEKAATLHHE